MPRVLVIDDSEAIHFALNILLGGEGYGVLSARSPEEGIRILADDAVDLVLQDMNFRGDGTSAEEGLMLFRRIREVYPSIPIVVLTAFSCGRTATQMLRFGAVGYLTKPWDDTQLVALVHDVVDRRR